MLAEELAAPGGVVMDIALLVARAAFASLLLVSGLAKLFSIGATQASAASFGVPRRLAGPVAIVLPVAELAVAVTLVGDRSAAAGGWAAATLMTCFTVVVAAAVVRGRAVSCNCFGGLSASPVTGRTLGRNAVLLLAAVAVAVGTADEVAPLGIPYASFDATEWITAALLAVIVLLAVTASHVIGMLLQQQGRLLLRVDALEARDASAGHPGHQHAEPTYGLPVGSVAPSFGLPGLHGETLTLESLTARGRPVLLEFADPHCAPCAELAPVVARWQREAGDTLTVAVIAGGSLDDNRAKAAEHGLTTVLLDEGGEVTKAYASPGTPSAVLIGVDGRILSETAAGPPGVTALGERMVGAAAAAPPPAPGVELGDAMPAFELTALDGALTSSAELIGAGATVFLFWDPACGFCQRMQARLQHWDHQSLGSERRLVVVSTGSADATAELDLQAPVLLDNGSVMRSFGISGTPMAVLVDGDGRIASSAAAGEQAVFDLLGSVPGADSRSLPLVPGGQT